MCAMMPERLANTDPFKQITEMVGCGPFKWVADERVQGSRNVYGEFDEYVPRDGGTPDWTRGPKIVHFDRVEWTTIPTPPPLRRAAERRAGLVGICDPRPDAADQRDRRGCGSWSTNPTGAVT